MIGFVILTHSEALLWNGIGREAPFRKGSYARVSWHSQARAWEGEMEAGALVMRDEESSQK